MTKPKPQEEPPASALHKLLPDVTPLPRANRAHAHKPPPTPVAAQRTRNDRAVLDESLCDADPWEQGFENGDELNFLRPGLASDTLRKLRRGHWKLQADIDLHGLTVAEARPALVEFLNECLREGLRCVRVIHGKGLGSKNREPVLKRKVASWLAQRDEILAFCQARRTEGGGGAAVVLLRGGKRERSNQ
ncbi:MAG: DNA mismatch repair protein MutS [Betaproteobacteria bacterium]|nr:DNA mismatch repair protein MutS [Betaproteobacteria bacterium]